MSKKEQILSLKREGKTYKQITEIMSCGIGTVSYHCQKAGFSRSGITSEEFTNKQLKRNKELKLLIKIKAVEALGGKCSICGYNKSLKALDFHHLDPSKKEFGISESTSWNKAKEEIKKCILVCKNCHSELHD